MHPCSARTALNKNRQLGTRIKLDQRVTKLADKDIALLREVLDRHGVICIHGQSLSPLELQDFASRWGEIIVLPGGLALANQEPGLPGITRIGNLRPDGSIIHSVRFAEYWHHDGDFWPPGKNFIVNFLNSAIVPAVGGNTGFLDSRVACAQLTPPERKALEDTHICVRASEITDFKQAAPHEIPPDVQHRTLLPHSITGEIALYLPLSSTGIQTREGQCWGTVESLIESCERRVGIVEHVWSEGDLLIIDNLQVMHRSMGGYADNPRLLYRCQARLG